MAANNEDKIHLRPSLYIIHSISCKFHIELHVHRTQHANFIKLLIKKDASKHAYYRKCWNYFPEHERYMR